MGPATRSVRRVRLQAPDAAAARRAAVVLEDALRVASLPDRTARILLVRRLALPAIELGASSQTVALELERALERSRIERVHGGAVGVATASAVWFADALDLHLHAARRLVMQGTLSEWYWPLAIPALRADAPSETLRHVALSLAGVEEATIALPVWLAEVAAEPGGLEALRRALTPGDVDHLARVLSLELRSTRVPSQGMSHIESAHTNRAPSSGWFERPNFTRPVESAVDALLQRMAEVHRRKSQAIAYGARALPGPGGAGGIAPYQRSMAITPQGHADPTIGRGVSSNAHTPGAYVEIHSAAYHPWNVGPDSFGAWTGAGGLLFLLPVLRRLGYEEWIRKHSAWSAHEIARCVLSHVLVRLGVPSSDEAWSLVAPERDALRAVPLRFLAPTEWREVHARHGVPQRRGHRGWCGWLYDRSARLLLAAWVGAPPIEIRRARGRSRAVSDDSIEAPRTGREVSAAAIGMSRRSQPARWHDGAARVEAVTNAWVTAARRWLRRRAGIGLCDLVLRPARVAATRTHVDVAFNLASSDARIRRSGLDLDPGWLPWFGRVISFRYELEPWS